MHDNGSDTRLLRLSDRLEANEWAEGQEHDEAQAAAAQAAALTASQSTAAVPKTFLPALPIPGFGRAALPQRQSLPLRVPAASTPRTFSATEHSWAKRRILLPSEVLARSKRLGSRATSAGSLSEVDVEASVPPMRPPAVPGTSSALVVHEMGRGDGTADSNGPADAMPGSVICFAVEVMMHGVSVALIDSTPRELVQLNLRGIHLGLIATPVRSNTTFRLRALTVDNLMTGSFNPLLLASEPAPSLRAGAPPEEAISLLVVKRIHPTHAAFRLVELKLAPLNVVLDLALLKALSAAAWESDAGVASAAAGRPAINVGCSDRLAATFGVLRTQGIDVPEDVLRRSRVARSEQLYLQKVVLCPMRLSATVAMGATYVSDPSRELLEVLEDLVPHVPKALEHLLPVLANLASVTDASFKVSAFEVRPLYPFLHVC